MRRYLLLCLLALNALVASAQSTFVVSDIRVEGLQRISAGSVFSALPINVGDSVDEIGIANAIRSLFRSGNFDDIKIGRDGSVMVVIVVERPSISEINLDGNKAIDSESLLKGLNGAGLAEGRVFKRSTLDGMRMELTRQYVSQGRYDANIETEVVSLPRNRVGVNINIDEGNTAAIKHINIVGNQVWGDAELIDLFELKTTGWFSWIKGDDKYAKEKLSGDLETLTSHYMDQGYLKFNIDSTQVSVSPDREAVYITVNVNEGEKYTVADVELSGDLVLEEEQLRPFIFIRTGEVFSQAQVTATEKWLTKRLGNDGYNFAKVKGIPELNDDEQVVSLKFFIDPGKRTYVRRINFNGNTTTADEVLRREMRQFEGAPASSSNIELSKVRLDRLGFFKQVDVDTQEVPGTDDLIDLQYTVEEQPSGSIGASVGFSQDSGVLLGANIQQDNFLGTGKQIGVGVNKSDYLTNIRFSYVDPYYTEDGVSRGFSVFYREADLEEINISSYSTNTLGASLNFGYPIKETERLGFSFGYTNTEIQAGRGAVQEIKTSPRPYQIDQVSVYSDFDGSVITGGETQFSQESDITKFLTATEATGFLDVYGEEFNNFTVTGSWTQSTLNRGRMATNGASQSLSLELSVPGSDLEYYKLTYNAQVFFPITQAWVVRLRTEIGYGDGYANVEELPFYQHFYAGGFGSVRGFKSNTLGPRSTTAIDYALGRVDTNGDGLVEASYLLIDTDGDGNGDTFQTQTYDNDTDPFGGNLLFEGSAELIFPLPFIKDQRTFRTVFFVDWGNVFSTDCRNKQGNCFDFDLGELRYSAGVGLSWITGFGPLTFSYAVPFNDNEFDETEAFQFSLGRSF